MDAGTTGCIGHTRSCGVQSTALGTWQKHRPRPLRRCDCAEKRKTSAISCPGPSCLSTAFSELNVDFAEVGCFVRGGKRLKNSNNFVEAGKATVGGGNRCRRKIKCSPAHRCWRRPS